MTATDLNAAGEPPPAAVVLPAAAASPAASLEASAEPSSQESPARSTRRRPGAPALWVDSRRGRIGALCVAGVVAATALIVFDAASHSSPLVPHQPYLFGYLNDIGAQLSFQTFVWAVLAISLCYAGAALCARALRPRLVIGAIVALHVLLFAGPVLFSQDIFQYLDYARLGALHGINPFLHGPIADRHDIVYRYVGDVWHHVPTAYGPVFTLVTYPIALLGVDGGLWGLKLLGVVSSLGALWMVWLCARRLGRDPVTAVVLVGLNPIWLIYGLGGFHNDLMMDALMLLGVWLTLRQQDARGAAAVVIGAAVKATAAAVLPFMLIAHRRLSVLWGTLAALAVVAVISLLAFGVHPLDFVSVVRRDATFVSSDSFPNEVAHLLGYPGVFQIDRKLLTIATGIAVLWVMWRTWRGYDWISGAAVTLLLLAVTTTWLLAWYLLWSLPLAVLARDRRVLYATLVICGLFVAHQTGPLFTPT